MLHTFSKYIIVAAAVLLLLPACEKNIAIEPVSGLDAARGFTTRQDAEAASLIGCYSNLQNNNYWGTRYTVLCDLYADNLAHTGTFPSFAQIANRAMLPDNTEATNMWNVMYAGINRCNNAIVSTGKIEDPAFSNKNTILGEAHFLRAFHYFNLLRFFGGGPAGFNKPGGLGVPVFLQPTLTPADAEPKPRAAEAEVWAQIMEDLDFAIANLPANVATGRANKRAATALKARAHLYRNEWAEAEAAAKTVIETGGYALTGGREYADIYLKKNTAEAIWELQFDPSNTNSIAFFYYPTSLGGRNEVTSAAGLKSAHTAGDLRLLINVTATPANKTQKYTRVAGDDNILLIRLAEMYLIRAEALLWQGKTTEALADLNVIIQRAGLPEYAETNTDAILDRILLERRLEFAHEGHRFFDLKRLNKFAAALGVAQDFRALWPIPQREVDTGAGVIGQNPGY